MIPPRQVVLIMTDTQGVNVTGCYGKHGVRTPNIDALAARGIRFDRAYTCQPVCGPARAALFTGTFPHTNGGWSNVLPLGDNVKTIGQRLADAGLPAVYIGKWHLDGGDYFGTGRAAPGWDAAYWYDMRNYLEELTPEERVRSRDVATNRQGVNASFTFANRCTNRACDYLSKHSADDFLLVVSYDEPHHPFLCPREFLEMYKDYRYPVSAAFCDSLEGKPEHQKVWAGGKLMDASSPKAAAPADYFASISYVDHEIGRVLAAIEKHCPGALVIFTSDHGDFLGAHHLNSKGPATYDDIARIPLIVRQPGVTPENATTAAPVSHINIVPTLLEHFGLAIPQTIEGKSILPTLRDPSTRVQDAAFIEFGRYETDHDGFGGFQPLRCICDGRYKLTINLLTSDELYDLDTDPCEVTNLIDSPAHTAIRNALHDRLLDWMNDTRDPFRGYYWERRPWRTDARPATWSYTGMTRQRIEDPRYEPRQLDYATGLEITEAVRKK